MFLAFLRVSVVPQVEGTAEPIQALHALVWLQSLTFQARKVSIPSPTDAMEPSGPDLSHSSCRKGLWGGYLLISSCAADPKQRSHCALSGYMTPSHGYRGRNWGV